MDSLSKIAYITMIIDHVGKVFFPDFIVLQIIGRISYPLFAYKVSIGINKSSNIKCYFFRVLFIGIISQFFYFELFYINTLNICFTLCLGIIFTKSINNYNKHKFIYAIIIIISIIFASDKIFEYGLYGIGLIYIYNTINFQEINMKKFCIILIVQSLFTYICVLHYKWSLLQLFSILSLSIIYLFRKKQSNISKIKIKYLHYIIYPFHLILLYLIDMLFVN